MKSIRAFLFLLLLLVMMVCHAQSLPVIHLSGQFNDNYQPGIFTLDGQSYNVSVKWRGGTTGGPDKHKHNFKVKFSEDYQFLGLRSDNNWILDAGQVDPFRLRNRIATDIWLNMATPPYYYEREPRALSGARGKVVELYLNGQYEGIYCFGENVDRKQLRLLKQTPSEICGVLWKSSGYGYSSMWNVERDYDNTLPTWNVFEAKYPDLNDRDTTDYRTLYEAIDFVVNSTDNEFSAHVSDYFDLPVVMDYYLFINVLGAIDNVGKNTFWAVYDQSSADHRLTPAVWDLDLTVGTPVLGQYNPIFTSPYYTIFGGINLVHRLITLNVDDFNRRAYNRYQELRNTVFDTDALIQRYRDAADLLYESGAAQREIDRWSGDSDLFGREIDFNNDVDNIAQWLRLHLAHLDTVLCDTAILRHLSIEQVYPYQLQSHNNAIYNLQGQRQSLALPLKNGIYIRNGRKFIVSAQR